MGRWIGGANQRRFAVDKGSHSTDSIETHKGVMMGFHVVQQISVSLVLLDISLAMCYASTLIFHHSVFCTIVIYLFSFPATAIRYLMIAAHFVCKKGKLLCNITLLLNTSAPSK